MENQINHINSSYNLVVWHPDVHSKFGEALYFFLISPVTYDDWFQLKIENCLRSCNVQGWSLYTLYGFYDVLIRAWMSPEQKHSFSSNIQKETALLDISYFMASEMEYLWSSRQQQQKKLDTSLLNKYDNAILNSVQDKVPNINNIEILTNEGLILRNEKVYADKAFSGIKFYILINYPTAVNQDELKEEIIRFINKSNHPNIEGISVYSGFGFAKFLIKGIASINMYDITNFACDLTKQFKLIKMKSTTLLTASQNAFQSDNIFIKEMDSTVAIDKTIKELGIDSKQIENLNKYEIRLIHDKYQELVRKDIFPKHEKIFAPFFQDYVNKNSAALKKHLFIMIEFENDFRKFITKMLHKYYGRKWMETDFDRLRQSVSIPPKGYDRMTMTEWVNILGKVNSEKNNEIDNIIGPNWQELLRIAASLRNKVAHGRIDDPIEIWGDTLDFLSELMPIYEQIKKNI